MTYTTYLWHFCSCISHSLNQSVFLMLGLSHFFIHDSCIIHVTIYMKCCLFNYWSACCLQTFFVPSCWFRFCADAWLQWRHWLAVIYFPTYVTVIVHLQYQMGPSRGCQYDINGGEGSLTRLLNGLIVAPHPHI